MKTTLVKLILQCFVIFSLGDLAIRYLTDHVDFVANHNHLEEYYASQRVLDSAVENAIIGTFTVLAVLLFSQCKFGPKMRVKCDAGQFFMFALVFGFFLGLVDKMVIRKKSYATYVEKTNPVYAGVFSSVYYVVAATIILSLC